MIPVDVVLILFAKLYEQIKISYRERCNLMELDSKFENVANRSLYKKLSKLTPLQFKYFYCIFVHCWANHKSFISDKNFLNLWLELNQLCYDVNESFPEQCNNEELNLYCKAHPYYFIDMLPVDVIANLFSEYVDKHIDILSVIARSLYETNLKTTYTYIVKALDLDESIDELVAETEAHVKCFS